MGGIGSGGARIGAGRKPMLGETKAKVSVSMPQDMINQLRDEADRRKLPLSHLITELITKGLER